MRKNIHFGCCRCNNLALPSKSFRGSKYQFKFHIKQVLYTRTPYLIEINALIVSDRVKLQYSVCRALVLLFVGQKTVLITLSRPSGDPENSSGGVPSEQRPQTHWANTDNEMCPHMRAPLGINKANADWATPCGQRASGNSTVPLCRFVVTRYSSKPSSKNTNRTISN